MLFLPDLNSLLRPPYIFLILGVASISAAAVLTWTARCGSVLVAGSIALKNRGGFRGQSDYIILGGVWFIGYFLYKV